VLAVQAWEAMISKPIVENAVDPRSAPTIGSPLLVPFDGSANAEAVFPFVPSLVNDGKKVILLQVIPEPRPLKSPLGKTVLSADDLRRASETAAHADLARAADRLASIDPDLEIEQIVASGDPSDAIADVAVRVGARAMLLSSQGISGTGPGGFGSVAARVVRSTPVPVMIVQPSGRAGNQPPIARFVVAHDGSERASRVLPLVQDLAARLNIPIHVIAVVEHEESPIPAGAAARIDPHLRDEVLADALNLARRNLEETGATLLRHGLPASWQVLTGPVAPAIIDVCSSRDVLVFTSHGHSRGRWLLGSVAEKLIRESPVPVILLRTPPDQDEDART
jgi:nucleotide-binding universal stress UspA family protein